MLGGFDVGDAMLMKSEGSGAAGSRWRVAAAFAVFLTMTACRGGCGGDSGGELGKDPALRLLPAEVTVVLSVDFRRIRATSLWKELAALSRQDSNDKRMIEGLTAATGFDPFTQVHRLVAAFPEEARKSRAFALVIEGDPVDRGRLFQYLKAEAQRTGGDLVEIKRGARPFWTSGKAEGASGFFLDDRHFVLGGGGWAERMADLADAASGGAAAASARPAVAQPAFRRLVDRISRGRSLWLAAIVPEATRARLMADPRFGSDASVMRFGGSFNLGPGFEGDLVAELSNHADAFAMASKVTNFLAAAKKSPEVLLLGVAPYLDGIKAEAVGPDARIDVKLSPAETQELVGRLGGFLRMRRAAH
jgi:hypothetical protein